MPRKKMEQPVEVIDVPTLVAIYSIRLEAESGTQELSIGASDVDDRLFEFLSYLQLPKGFKIVVDRRKEVA